MITFIFLDFLVISLAVDCQIHGTLLKTRLDLAMQAGRENRRRTIT